MPLRQPTRLTHSSCLSRDDQLQKSHLHTKPIQKKKHIKKHNEPSTQRMNRINDAFDKLHNQSDTFISSLGINHGYLDHLVMNVKERTPCSGCGHRVRFYCAQCLYVPSHILLPQTSLPFDVYIIHHASQKVAKSSGIPLKLLSPNVHLLTYHGEKETDKTIQQQLFNKLPKSNRNYILYPHKDGKLLGEIFQKGKALKSGQSNTIQLQAVSELVSKQQPPIIQVSSDRPQNSLTHLSNPAIEIDSIILLDCTWFQTNQLLNYLQSYGYNQYIRLDNYSDLYWRYHHHGEKALSSAEAIGYLLREYQSVSIGNNNQEPQSKQSNLNYSNIQQPKQQVSPKEQQINNNNLQRQKYDNMFFLYALNMKLICQSMEINNNKESSQKIQKRNHASSNNNEPTPSNMNPTIPI